MAFYGLLTAALLAACCLYREPVQNRGRRCDGRMTRERALNLCVLALLFTAMTVVAALRIDVGNDYGNYVNTFHEIYMNGYVVTEPGFNLFVRLVYVLCGGENYLVVFALFAAATSALFLRAMVDQSVDFRLSFALFMLMGLYFRTFNTVRYYFVLAVTLYSLRYVLRGEWGKFFIWIVAAATFHKSVLVVIPLYFLAALPWRRWQVALGAVAAISLPVFRDFWMEIVLKLYPSYQNTVYLEKGTGLEGSLMGIVRCGAVLALCLAVWKDEAPVRRLEEEDKGPDDAEGERFKGTKGIGKSDNVKGIDGISRAEGIEETTGIRRTEKAERTDGILGRAAMKEEGRQRRTMRILELPANRFYLKLNLLGLAVYTCASFLPLVSRFGYYLITAHVLLVPGILCRLPEGRKKRLLYAGTLVFSVLYFAYFLLTAHQEGVRVLPYHTWIFTEKEWLNGSFVF